MHKQQSTRVTWHFRDFARGTAAIETAIFVPGVSSRVLLRTVYVACDTMSRISFVFQGMPYLDPALVDEVRKVLSAVEGATPVEAREELTGNRYVFTMQFPRVNGEPATETAMKIFIRSMDVLGVHRRKLVVPDIIQSTVVRLSDGSQKPYGQWLAEKYYPN